MIQKYGKEEIEKAASEPLERWLNEHGKYFIHLEHPEYSSLCPRSGYPDSAWIIVDYIPGDWVVELKAFKLFINSFRDQSISHEDAVNAIANKLNQDINPVSMRVIGDFMRRGGVKTVVTVLKGELEDFPEYKANQL